MNGNATGVLLWAVNLLLGLLIAAVSYILRLHKEADEEHRQRIDKEIDALRKRMHDWAGSIGWVELERRRDGRDD